MKAGQPDWIDTHCLRQIGLRTDYRAAEPPPPRTEQPYPKDGLAVSPPPVEPSVRLSPARAEARPLASELQRPSTAPNAGPRESSTIRSSRTSASASAGNRGGVALGEEPRLYYIEAVRQYQSEYSAIAVDVVRHRLVPPRERRVSLSGDGRRRAQLRSTRRQLHAAARRRPAGTRLFWLAQFSGWDHERYVVIEPKARAVDAVVNVWGGGC